MVFKDTLLKDEVALITGATRGIGRATAMALASVSAEVIICGRNAVALHAVTDEITASGGKTRAYVCDVTDFEQVDRMLADIIQVYKKIDILVNNAGISKEAPFDEMDWKDIEQIFKINQTAPIYLMYKILPIMVQQKHGHVINIGSGGAVRGLPGSAAYSSSKSGLLKYGEAVGDEVWKRGHHHVHVNTICPGPVDTEMFKKSAVREFILQGGGDLSTTEDIANAVIWLSTEKLSGVTNSQTLILRGFNRW